MVLNEVYCLGTRSCSPYLSIEVELPPNTTRWFYTMTTTKRPRKARRLKKHPAILAAFPAASLANSGISKTGYQPEPIPAGEGHCSIYLLKSHRDSYSFAEAGGVYSYYPEYSVKDLPSTVMLITESVLRHGTQYIGLKNPVAAQDASNTYVVLTVVAMTH